MMGVLSGGREWGGRIHLRKVPLTTTASAGDWLQLELGVWGVGPTLKQMAAAFVPFTLLTVGYSEGADLTSGAHVGPKAILQRRLPANTQQREGTQ